MSFWALLISYPWIFSSFLRAQLYFRRLKMSYLLAKASYRWIHSRLFELLILNFIAGLRFRRLHIFARVLVLEIASNQFSDTVVR